MKNIQQERALAYTVSIPLEKTLLTEVAGCFYDPDWKLYPA